jgi:hypothetical protein
MVAPWNWERQRATASGEIERFTMESVMLTESEANRVWQKMYEAEVRSLYFGSLAARYTKEKQIITGVSFLLSSGAAATVAAKLPSLVPIISASIAAVLTAYSIAVGLDRKAASMSRLKYQWSQIASDLERLWNHWYEDGAGARLEEILKLSREASQAGSSEAPYDEELMGKWQKRVNLLRGAANAA